MILKTSNKIIKERVMPFKVFFNGYKIKERHINWIINITNNNRWNNKKKTNPKLKIIHHYRVI